jgi:hypothetical protein
MDSNTTYKIGLFTILFLGGIALITKYEIDSTPTIIKSDITKVDSLKNVIDSLQTEIFVLEDGCDYKEHRYENVIDEYEMGMDYLKYYHPKAYKDFHRIIGMKEKYSKELERENSKILNQYKINKDESKY